MATLNANGAKTLQQNRLRPTASRPIVPAIPLPYVQKRQQRQAAHAKAREEAAAPAKVEAVAAPPSPPLPAQEPAPLVVNGSGREETLEKIEEVSEPAVSAKPSTPVVETDTVEEKEEKEVKVVEEANGDEGKAEAPNSGKIDILWITVRIADGLNQMKMSKSPSRPSPRFLLPRANPLRHDRHIKCPQILFLRATRTTR